MIYYIHIYLLYIIYTCRQVNVVKVTILSKTQKLFETEVSSLNWSSEGGRIQMNGNKSNLFSYFYFPLTQCGLAL